MRQRAMIAMALSCDPDLLIADEPTTALDVTVQAQILDLIRDLQKEFNSAVIIITHDLGVVAELADDIMVMYAGRAVEYGTADDDLHAAPSTPTRGACSARCRASTGCAPSACVPIKGAPPEPHQRAVGLPVPPAVRATPTAPGGLQPDRAARPVRRGLARHYVACHLTRAERTEIWRERDQADAVMPAPSDHHRSPVERRETSAQEPHRDHHPRQARPRPSWRARPCSQVDGLTKHFPIKRGLLQRQVGAVQAVDGLTFDVMRGETLSLVGESGCGKTTTGRLLTRLLEPTGGDDPASRAATSRTGPRGKMRPLRRDVQMIFQDPYSSLNPRHTVGTIVGAPYRLQQHQAREGRQARVQELLELVGLNPEHYNRYPHEFSGGQRQRIGIARVARPQAQAHRRRRAGLRARRVDPGAGHQPARGPAGRARA